MSSPTLYETYMKSESWRDKRRQRVILDDYRCRLCDHDGTLWRLEVHHRPSSYAKIPNESMLHDLITLCTRCHDAVTNAIRGDRYQRRSHEVAVQVSVVQERKELHNGMAGTEVSIDVRLPDARPQRPDSRSPQQVEQGDEGD